MRIAEIKLFADRLDELLDFYARILGLPLEASSEQAFTVVIGASKLTFARQAGEKPYYHFAFNIAESKMALAVEWLKAKGIVINLIDGKDVYHSVSWNSDSAYFYDPAGNVVEWIARHRRPSETASDSIFTVDDLLNISEIGLPATDVPELSAFLRTTYEEEVYLESNEMFAPIGDEEGLFILSSLNRNWLGSNKKVESFPLEIVIDKEGASNNRKSVPSYPYTIITN